MNKEVESMILYIRKALEGLNIDYQKRNDNGAIIVVPKQLINESTNKNVITYWETRVSVRVSLLPRIHQKTYYSVSEMESDNISQTIRNKYYELIR